VPESPVNFVALQCVCTLTSYFLGLLRPCRGRVERLILLCVLCVMCCVLCVVCCVLCVVCCVGRAPDSPV